MKAQLRPGMAQRNVIIHLGASWKHARADGTDEEGVERCGEVVVEATMTLESAALVLDMRKKATSSLPPCHKGGRIKGSGQGAVVPHEGRSPSLLL